MHKKKKDRLNLMTQDERDALGLQVDYNGSHLTPEQRRALIKSYLSYHLEHLGLRSPQHYWASSPCPSVTESTWPGVVSMIKVDHLKKGYLDPDDLVIQLRKLKPSENYEFRNFCHPFMSWNSPTPLEEEGFEQLPPDPDWFFSQIYGIGDVAKRAGTRTTEPYTQAAKAHWQTILSGVVLTPVPDSYLLQHEGHSPGGTIFPWYLVKGLLAIRDQANTEGYKAHDDEYAKAEVRRKEAIDRWQEENPDTVLAVDWLSIYRTWPAGLMQRLDQISQEAVHYGRVRYIEMLKEAEKKMQALVTFYRDGGLITGRRTPPSLHWQIPKYKAKQMPQPQYLKVRLSRGEMGNEWFAERNLRSRTTARSRWLESVISGEPELIESNTPVASPVLEQLDKVWQERDNMDIDDTEDEMIAVFRRWRESRNAKCLEKRTATTATNTRRSSTTKVAPRVQGHEHSQLEVSTHRTAPEEISDMEQTQRLREKISGGRLRHSKTRSQATGNLSVWSGRLRPRAENQHQSPRHIHSSNVRSTATKADFSKPIGITKRRRTSRTKQSSSAIDQATTYTPPRAAPAISSNLQSPHTVSPPQPSPESATKAEGGRAKSRRLPRRNTTMPITSVQASRISKPRRSKKPVASSATKSNNALLHLLTPPLSE